MNVALKPACVSRRSWLRRRISAWLGPRPGTQIAIVLALIAIFFVLGSNIAGTMARVGSAPGFGFLTRAANFEIGESTIAFHAGDTYARAIVVGLVNTAKIALLGCGLATILGVALGVMRLSGNLALSGLVRAYVEIVRNTPLLLQLFFWIALAHALPVPRRAIVLFHSVLLTNRGLFVPGLIVHALSWGTILLVVAVIAAWIGLVWWGWRQKPFGFLSPISVSILAIVLLATIVFVTDTSVALEIPTISGFNVQGGCSLTPEFAALLAGLTVKFSAIISEIVRAGILSVREEQWDAARALGLHRGKIIRLVVLPQALRVITPLSTSSYLDLVKDSSLAVAIGYPDIMNIVNTTANTTGQAFEALLIVVVLYLSLNLFVSVLMGVYNSRVALRGEKLA
ncbi:amino acid ABC transporter permease [Bradyrhizobium sp. USDA 10063]